MFRIPDSAWKDFILEKTCGEGQGVSFEGGKMILDWEAGRVGSIETPFDTKPPFLIEIDARVLEIYDPNFIVGFIFADKVETFLSVFFTKTDVVLSEKTGAEKKGLQARAIPPVQVGVRHRLIIQVEGQRIQAWFDGVRAIDYVNAHALDFQAAIGPWQQKCKVEYRAMRFGKLK